MKDVERIGCWSAVGGNANVVREGRVKARVPDTRVPLGDERWKMGWREGLEWWVAVVELMEEVVERDESGGHGGGRVKARVPDTRVPLGDEHWRIGW